MRRGATGQENCEDPHQDPQLEGKIDLILNLLKLYQFILKKLLAASSCSSEGIVNLEINCHFISSISGPI